jgi:hypothetical protein
VQAVLAATLVLVRYLEEVVVVVAGAAAVQPKPEPAEQQAKAMQAALDILQDKTMAEPGAAVLVQLAATDLQPTEAAAAQVLIGKV